MIVIKKQKSRIRNRLICYLFKYPIPPIPGMPPIILSHGRMFFSFSDRFKMKNSNHRSIKINIFFQCKKRNCPY